MILFLIFFSSELFWSDLFCFIFQYLNGSANCYWKNQPELNAKYFLFEVCPNALRFIFQREQKCYPSFKMAKTCMKRYCASSELLFYTIEKGRGNILKLTTIAKKGERKIKNSVKKNFTKAMRQF